jgi:iron(III) transport system substrate-binding protein
MRKFTIAGTLVPLTLLLVACGGSPTSPAAGSGDGDGAGKAEAHAQEVYDKINGLSGEERTKELVELAEKEGGLSIYTSNTDLDDLVDGFEDEYDIDVSVYRGNSESVLQRVLQEQKADFHGVDLVETNALELNVLNQEGYLYPYEGELRDKVREQGQAEGWTADRFNVFVVGWNTDKVKPGEEPTSLEDLTDPRWKGQVSLEIGDVDWFTALYQYYQDQGKSEEETLDIFRGLAANSKTVKGHTVQGELLSAGQFATAVSLYSHTVDKADDKGAPVAWRPESGEPVQPLVIRPNGAGLVKNAANPAAAMLFMDYVLTDGQDIVAESFRIGSIPSGDDPLEGLEVIPVPEDELLANPQKWDELYADVIQGGEEVSE